MRLPSGGLANLGFSGEVDAESGALLAGEAGIVLNLFFPSRPIADLAAALGGRVARGVLDTVLGRAWLTIGLRALSEPDEPMVVRLLVVDGGDLLSVVFDVGVANDTRFVVPGLLFSAVGLEIALLPSSSTELVDALGL